MFQRNKTNNHTKSKNLKVTKEINPIIPDKINLNELLNNHINNESNNMNDINNPNDLELESQNTVDITSDMDDNKIEYKSNKVKIQSELKNGTQHKKISFNNLKYEMDHLVENERENIVGNNQKIIDDKSKLDMNDILNL